MDDRVELRLGPAEERLRELPAAPELDFAFIDAEKTSYPTYWAELNRRKELTGFPGDLTALRQEADPAMFPEER